MVLFGNWYSDLLRTTMQTGAIDDAQFDAYLEDMRVFEQDLKITMLMWSRSGSTCPGKCYKTPGSD